MALSLRLSPLLHAPVRAWANRLISIANGPAERRFRTHTLLQTPTRARTRQHMQDGCLGVTGVVGAVGDELVAEVAEMISAVRAVRVVLREKDAVHIRCHITMTNAAIMSNML